MAHAAPGATLATLPPDLLLCIAQRLTPGCGLGALRRTCKAVCNTVDGHSPRLFLQLVPAIQQIALSRAGRSETPGSGLQASARSPVLDAFKKWPRLRWALLVWDGASHTILAQRLQRLFQLLLLEGQRTGQLALAQQAVRTLLEGNPEHGVWPLDPFQPHHGPLSQLLCAPSLRAASSLTSMMLGARPPADALAAAAHELQRSAGTVYCLADPLLWPVVCWVACNCPDYTCLEAALGLAAAQQEVSGSRLWSETQSDVSTRFIPLLLFTLASLGRGQLLDAAAGAASLARMSDDSPISQSNRLGCANAVLAAITAKLLLLQQQQHPSAATAGARGAKRGGSAATAARRGDSRAAAAAQLADAPKATDPASECDATGQSSPAGDLQQLQGALQRLQEAMGSRPNLRASRDARLVTSEGFDALARALSAPHSDPEALLSLASSKGLGVLGPELLWTAATAGRGVTEFSLLPEEQVQQLVGATALRADADEEQDGKRRLCIGLLLNRQDVEAAARSVARTREDVTTMDQVLLKQLLVEQLCLPHYLGPGPDMLWQEDDDDPDFSLSGSGMPAAGAVQAYVQLRTCCSKGRRLGAEAVEGQAEYDHDEDWQEEAVLQALQGRTEAMCSALRQWQRCWAANQRDISVGDMAIGAMGQVGACLHACALRGDIADMRAAFATLDEGMDNWRKVRQRTARRADRGRGGRGAGGAVVATAPREGPRPQASRLPHLLARCSLLTGWRWLAAACYSSQAAGACSLVEEVMEAAADDREGEDDDIINAALEEYLGNGNQSDEAATLLARLLAPHDTLLPRLPGSGPPNKVHMPLGALRAVCHVLSLLLVQGWEHMDEQAAGSSTQPLEERQQQFATALAFVLRDECLLAPALPLALAALYRWRLPAADVLAQLFPDALALLHGMLQALQAEVARRVGVPHNGPGVLPAPVSRPDMLHLLDAVSSIGSELRPLMQGLASPALAAFESLRPLPAAAVTSSSDPDQLLVQQLAPLDPGRMMTRGSALLPDSAEHCMQQCMGALQCIAARGSANDAQEFCMPAMALEQLWRSATTCTGHWHRRREALCGTAAALRELQQSAPAWFREAAAEGASDDTAAAWRSCEALADALLCLVEQPF